MRSWLFQIWSLSEIQDRLAFAQIPAHLASITDTKVSMDRPEFKVVIRDAAAAVKFDQLLHDPNFTQGRAMPVPI
ncbi:MAG TPA: hypothetical protein VGL81_31525 [Polyangiaceae bacterium]|jgi:hypothetical protein